MTLSIGVELSSLSYLSNDKLSEPHLDFEQLLHKSSGVSLFSGTINGLIGKLFDKGKFSEIEDLYLKLKSQFNIFIFTIPIGFFRSNSKLCSFYIKYIFPINRWKYFRNS